MFSPEVRAVGLAAYHRGNGRLPTLQTVPDPAAKPTCTPPPVAAVQGSLRFYLWGGSLLIVKPVYILLNEESYV